MIIKFFIFFVMLAIVGSLFSGLFFLIQDRGNSKRTVRALTLRIVISLSLFVLLLLAFKLGWIQPHSL
jgi:hypothetical protein